MPQPLFIHCLDGRFAVCRLDPSDAIPAWAMEPSPLLSVTRTEQELSIIVAEHLVPDAVVAERGYVAYALAGPLAFAMVGVLARLTGALAIAKVPVLAISTYDTDLLLVKAEQRLAAEAALREVAVIAE